jgi:hypothetical protein
MLQSASSKFDPIANSLRSTEGKKQKKFTNNNKMTQRKIRKNKINKRNKIK